MEYKILLSKSEDTKAVESQEQSRFIKSILETLELPIEFDPDDDLSVEKRQKLRREFKEFDLHVIDDINGGIKIYIGNDLIAEWYKTTYKLKQDLSEKDRRDRLYLEASINFWTMFENDEPGEESESET